MYPVVFPDPEVLSGPLVEYTISDSMRLMLNWTAPTKMAMPAFEAFESANANAWRARPKKAVASSHDRGPGNDR